MEYLIKPILAQKHSNIAAEAIGYISKYPFERWTLTNKFNFLIHGCPNGKRRFICEHYDLLVHQNYDGDLLTNHEAIPVFSSPWLLALCRLIWHEDDFIEVSLLGGENKPDTEAIVLHRFMIMNDEGRKVIRRNIIEWLLGQTEIKCQSSFHEAGSSILEQFPSFESSGRDKRYLIDIYDILCTSRCRACNEAAYIPVHEGTNVNKVPPATRGPVGRRGG